MGISIAAVAAAVSLSNMSKAAQPAKKTEKKTRHLVATFVGESPTAAQIFSMLNEHKDIKRITVSQTHKGGTPECPDEDHCHALIVSWRQHTFPWYSNLHVKQDRLQCVTDVCSESPRDAETWLLKAHYFQDVETFQTGQPYPCKELKTVIARPVTIPKAETEASMSTPTPAAVAAGSPINLSLELEPEEPVAKKQRTEDYKQERVDLPPVTFATGHKLTITLKLEQIPKTDT